MGLDTEVRFGCRLGQWSRLRVREQVLRVRVRELKGFEIPNGF